MPPPLKQSNSLGIHLNIINTWAELTHFILSAAYKWAEQGHQDTQHNDTQHNDTQHNNTRHKGNILLSDIQHSDIQHYDTQHYAECRYAESGGAPIS